uniref:Uncharacterized protein n=1 Tax=Anopheles melas TaxID=34690 RepID=A0A182TXG2_9DIPT
MSRKRPRESLGDMMTSSSSSAARLTIDETVSITIDPNGALEDRLATQHQQHLQADSTVAPAAASADGTPDNSMNGSSRRFSSIRLVDEGIEPSHSDHCWPPNNDGALNGHVNFGLPGATGRPPRSSDPVSPPSVSSNGSSSVATSSGFASQHATSGVEHSPPVNTCYSTTG